MKLQAYLGDIVGSIPDHHNKGNITIKWVIIFLTSICKKKYLWSSVKWSVIKQAMPLFELFGLLDFR